MHQKEHTKLFLEIFRKIYSKIYSNQPFFYRRTNKYSEFLFPDKTSHKSFLSANKKREAISTKKHSIKYTYDIGKGFR